MSTGATAVACRADLQATREWLTRLHGNSPGYVHICSVDNWTGQAFTDLDEATAYVDALNQREPVGIYVRATTLREPLAPGKRGGAEHALALPGMWGDVDIAGPGHKADGLPPDEEAGRRIVEASGLPAPSAWIHSGGGLYPWWLLTEPHTIADRTAIAQLSEAWQAALGRGATQLGWKYGTGVSDLARVLRIPGTINRKEGLARPCRLLQDTGERFTLDELNRAVAAVTPLHTVRPPAAPRQNTTPAAPRQRAVGEITPGDDFNAQVSWNDILPPVLMYLRTDGSGESYWIREGKSPNDGHSATTNFNGNDRLKVFTDAAPPFENNRTYDKLGAYAALHHNGDIRAAAKDLRARGYGSSNTLQVFVPNLEVDEEKPTIVKRSWDDIGNAQRLADHHGRHLRWLADAEKWGAYADGHWSIGESGTIAWQRVRETIEALPHAEAGLYSDERPPEKEPTGPGRRKETPELSPREKFLEFVAKQRFKPRLSAMLEVARSLPELVGRITDFDTNDMLLNCANGVLDLRTGELLPHDPSLMLMHRTPVRYNPDAKAPLWEAFLARIMPEQERRDYLRRITGYTLTGSIDEQAIFIHHGVGANGKSVFMKTLKGILGSYGQVVPRSTLLAKPGDGIPNDVARMQGKRLLITSETSAGKRLDDELVKQLTGGEEISARYMRSEFFDFKPVGKIHLMTNHLPAVGGGHGIARRLQDIGWDVVIPDDQQDKSLADRIIATELPGVLAWAVRGCAEWLKGGLAVPDSVRAKTAEHVFHSDPLASWLELRVERMEGCVTETRTLYQDYRNEAVDAGVKPMSEKAFSEALVERGYERDRDTTTRRSVVKDVRLHLLPAGATGQWLGRGSLAS